MVIDMQIDQRLTAVEIAVRDMQRQMTILPPATNWLEQIVGSFKDEPAFDEVLEYGRLMRSSDRPSYQPEDAGEQT